MYVYKEVCNMVLVLITIIYTYDVADMSGNMKMWALPLLFPSIEAMDIY